MIEELLDRWVNKEIRFYELFEALEYYVTEEREEAFSDGYHRGYYDGEQSERRSV